MGIHLGDMDPGDFRRAGISSSTGSLTTSRIPAVSRSLPRSSRRHRAALPASAPADGEPFDAIFSDFERILVPGLTHWNHPGFFAYFAITGSAPGVLAEMLSAALNVQAMLWRTSPTATELEEVTLVVAAQAPRPAPSVRRGDLRHGVDLDAACAGRRARARRARCPHARDGGARTFRACGSTARIRHTRRSTRP